MARVASLLLLALLAAPCLAPLADAQAQRVWTVFTTVDASVSGNYATVRVIADIANRGPDPEFPFQVRIPDDAFVTGLTIERDGKVYTAQIQEREAARAQYEETKAAQQTGGLVEKDRHSSVYAYLINVAEFTNVRATLTYERYLVAERGVYNLSLEAPVSGFGQDQGARFQVNVTDAAGVESLWGTPAAQGDAHAIRYDVGPRTNDSPTLFTASYTLKPTDGAGSLLTYVHNGTGYFAHRFRAPADATRMPVDMVLVLDVSGSMSGLKISQMKDAASQLVRGLSGDDKLGLVVFSSDASSAWSGLRSMSATGRADAAKEIDALLAGGGTNLEAALRKGFEGFSTLDASREEGRLPLLVVLTDGVATEGATDGMGLRALARAANTHGAEVFAIAFGADADWSLLHAIADEGRGSALRVPEGVGAEVDLRRFLGALATPVLKDVSTTYDHATQALVVSRADTLFAGTERLVVGTFDPEAGPLHATTTARATDGARTYTTSATSDATLAFLPRLVAYQQIRALDANISAEGARQEWTQEATRLALQWSFVTDRTSLVLSLDPRAPTNSTPTTPQQETVMADQAPDASSAPFSSARGSATSMPVPTTTTPVAASPATSSGGPIGSPTHATPSPAVPGAGVWLTVLAIAMALAIVARRRAE